MTLKSYLRSPWAAMTLPMLVFTAAIALASGLRMLGGEAGPLWLSRPEYWLWPLQSLLCAAVLIIYWKQIDWGARHGGWILATTVGLVILATWIAPSFFPNAAPRTEGFDPFHFEDSPLLTGLIIASRMFRLIVIVPLVEEIFWRGFLMRYLVREDFTKVPFGTYTPLSFFGTAIAFTLIHQPADYPAALLCGLLIGWVSIRTKSLAAAVLAHAVANLGLGIFILQTREWGYW